MVTPDVVSAVRGTAGTRVLGPTFAAATSQVDVEVDEAGDQRAAVEVDDLGAPGGRRGLEVTDGEDPVAADQDVAAPEHLWRPDDSVAEQEAEAISGQPFAISRTGGQR